MDEDALEDLSRDYQTKQKDVYQGLSDVVTDGDDGYD